MKVFKQITFSIIFCFLFYSTSWACYSPPSEYLIGPEDLIKKTEKIYYAEAIAKDEKFNYEFKVIEDLRNSPDAEGLVTKIMIFLKIKKPTVFKSMVGSTFKLQGFDRPYKNENFENHSNEIFNRWSVGRAEIAPDCELAPTFQVGKKYLIFFDKPFTFKSFEEISSTDDRWYIKTKELVKK